MSHCSLFQLTTPAISVFFFMWAQSLSSALPARGNVLQECTEFWENTHSHSRSLCGSVLSVERSEHKEGFLCSIFGTEGQWELSCCPDTNTYRLSLHCSLNNRIIVWGPWSHLLYYLYCVFNLGGTNRNSRSLLGDRASEWNLALSCNMTTSMIRGHKLDVLTF